MSTITVDAPGETTIDAPAAPARPAKRPRRRRRRQPSATLMHLSDTCCPPFERTLCGRRIPLIHNIVPLDVALDTCVVCVELHRRFECRRCGSVAP